MTKDGYAVYSFSPYTNIKDIEEVSKDILNIANDKLDILNLYSVYGYLYESHTDYNYYIATQKFIWSLMGYYTTFSYSENNFNNNQLDLFDYESIINNLVVNHYVRPNFENRSSIKFNLDQKISVLDMNGVINTFRIDNNTNYNLTINNNYLNLSCDNRNCVNSSVTFTKKRSNNDVNMHVYIASENVLFSYENAPLVEHTLFIEKGDDETIYCWPFCSTDKEDKPKENPPIDTKEEVPEEPQKNVEEPQIPYEPIDVIYEEDEKIVFEIPKTTTKENLGSIYLIITIVGLCYIRKLR